MLSGKIETELSEGNDARPTRRAVADTIAHYGVYGAIVGGILIVLFIGALHIWRRRVVEET